MNVEVIVDSQDIFPYLFEGSVLQEVKKKKDVYVGLFCSMFGSYTVEIPVDRCIKIKTK